MRSTGIALFRKAARVLLLLAAWMLGAAATGSLYAQESLIWVEQSDDFIIGGDLLRIAATDGSGIQDLIDVKATGPAVHIALDDVNGRFYWASDGRIGRVNLDGTGAELILGEDAFGGSPTLGAITVDPEAQMIYWANFSQDRIQRATVDGSDLEDIVTSVDSPEALALDPEEGKVYWGGSAISGGFIQRANIDGTDVEDVVTSGVWLPKAIVLDLPEGKMYWTDLVANNIRRANLDGTEAENLISEIENPDALALDLGASKMYWSDRGRTSQPTTIHRADLDGSDAEELLTEDANGMAFDVAEGRLYWTANGFIREADSEDLTPEDVTSFTSSINEIHLDPTAGFVYWEDNSGNIMRAPIDGSYIERVAGGVNGFWLWPSLVLSESQEKIFWADDGGVIGRADLDGTNAEDIVSDQDRPRYLALDEVNERIYWLSGSNFTPNELNRAGLDGSNAEELTGIAGDNPAELIVDPAGGRLYWIHGEGFANTIRTADLDGANMDDIASTTGFMEKIALDPAGGKIYWVESRGIYRADIDGGGEEELVAPDRQDLLHLDLENGLMYWTTTNANADQSDIFRANLDGSGIEEIVSDLDRVIDFIPTSAEPTSIGDESQPLAFRLHAAYPNPFNPTTTISFDLQRPGGVTITVYDVLGRPLQRVHRKALDAGPHEERVDMSGFAAGAYLYELKVLDERGGSVFRDARTFVLAK